MNHAALQLISVKGFGSKVLLKSRLTVHAAGHIAHFRATQNQMSSIWHDSERTQLNHTNHSLTQLLITMQILLLVFFFSVNKQKLSLYLGSQKDHLAFTIPFKNSFPQFSIKLVFILEENQEL